jgi:ABC-type multidrug transport system fused ATPase/permease subunit
MARRARSHAGTVSVSRKWRVIGFDQVTFGYDADRRIVSDLTLEIHRGDFWAILGPSGIGKTTLLDLILGLVQPHAGGIRIDQTPLSEVALKSWHGQIAYMGQAAFAFAGTVRDNLNWGSDREASDEELIRTLAAVHLGGPDPPALLDRDVGEDGGNLSGGEKQRLALARLFLRQPTLMILDEPTTGLDAGTEREILESIRSNFSESTLIMVTHREALTAGADHVIRLTEDGIHIEGPSSVSGRVGPNRNP